MRITAGDDAGAFYAQQTLAQLGTPVPFVTIEDHPRFAYRGAMLDVARHFFSVEQVERYLDQLAMFKLNHLHLHLTDDQGWRIQIDSWPRLTEVGGLTSVGDGGGGFYIEGMTTPGSSPYAQERVPSRSCPRSTCPGTPTLHSWHTRSSHARASTLSHYTGIEVGFSTLCIGQPETNEVRDGCAGRGRRDDPRSVPPHRRRRVAVDDGRGLPRVRARPHPRSAQRPARP